MACIVAPVCEVEGHIKKVDDLFVSFDCDFKAIGFDECGPTISDHTKQHCRNKRSMITPEA